MLMLTTMIALEVELELTLMLENIISKILLENFWYSGKILVPGEKSAAQRTGTRSFRTKFSVLGRGSLL